MVICFHCLNFKVFFTLLCKSATEKWDIEKDIKFEEEVKNFSMNKRILNLKDKLRIYQFHCIVFLQITVPDMVEQATKESMLAS